jgi:7,8-dihydropterin-6-yl-methyl-4-(beta-D-ribofuranosyl)aminobenzene 5'-phosphate synthase
MDDYCPGRGLRGEHGLSLYIETGGAKLLFDTGQGDAFLANASGLGIDLSSLDAVVLSHGHYDHGGGLKALFETLKEDPPPLFAGRGFDARRVAGDGASRKDIGLPRPFPPEQVSSTIEIRTIENLANGLYILPSAEMVFETSIDPKFRRVDGGAEPPDLFEDELSLVAVGDSGLAVITGCAHRGIRNIVEAARLAFPGRPMKAIVGGFHLVGLADLELAKIALALAAYGTQAVYCSHCTGLPGFAALYGALPGKVRWLSCGMQIDL